MSAIPSPSPRVSVVVPSHERPQRLATLLDALAAQTLPADQWEAVVVHDCAGEEAAELMRAHPLTREGRLRTFRLTPGTGSPSVQRNRGWHEAKAPLIAFTDDDCRPEPEWLESILSVAEAHPGAVVQGSVRPNPEEAHLLKRNPYVRTLEVNPPNDFAQTANILYPRESLEAVGGFDEGMPAAAGEDTELALRVRQAGADYVGAPDAVVNHAVEVFTLREFVRVNSKWQHLAYLARRHPHLRERIPLRIFFRESHMHLLLAAAGVAGSRKHPAALVLTAPYLKYALTARGRHAGGRLHAAIELPGRVIVDAAEVAAMIRGSVRYRTFIL